MSFQISTNRRSAIGLVAGAVAAMVSTMAVAQSEPTAPNVLLIVSDDQGFNDVGYNGSSIKTANIDGLAAGGLILDQFHTFPVCSPTRAALMTGRNPNNFGMWEAVFNEEGGPPLDEHFMPESFQAAGYQTWMMGKWHLGNDQEASLPNARGFDYAYGTHISANNYFTHQSMRYKVHDWFRNGEEVKEEGYTTYLLTDDAIDKIKTRDQDRPFFLYLPYVAPHTPLQAPEDIMALYAGEEDKKRQTYSAMVHAMDDSIGRVIATLEEEGLREDTLVIFLSDNGGNERRGGADNGALRGAKGTPWQGGIRTPALINWPGKIEPGTVSDTFLHAIDLFPTIASAIGLEPQNEKPLDGLDMWSHLADGEAAPDRSMLAQVSFSGGSVWDGDWKLVRTEYNEFTKLEPAVFLYNLAQDPSETTDVSADNTARTAAMLSALEEMDGKLTQHK